MQPPYGPWFPLWPPFMCDASVLAMILCSSGKVWQPEIVSEGRKGEARTTPQPRKGGWQPRRWLCSLCEKVREGQKEGKQSRPRTLFRAGYRVPPSQNWHTGFTPCQEVAEGAVDKYWMRSAIWAGWCSPDQLSDNSGINYSQICSWERKRKRAQNSRDKKCTL